MSLFRRHPMPLWMGFAFIGYMEWRRIRRRQHEKPEQEAKIQPEVQHGVTVLTFDSAMRCTNPWRYRAAVNYCARLRGTNGNPSWRHDLASSALWAPVLARFA